MIAEFFLGLAGNLTYEVLSKSGVHIFDAVLNVEQRELNNAYKHAFEVMFTEIPVVLLGTDPKQVKANLDQVGKEWHDFVSKPDVHHLLLELALAGYEEQTAVQLRAAFANHPFTIGTQNMIDMLIIGLADGFRVEAEKPDSKMFNKVTLGKLERMISLSNQSGAQIDELRQAITELTKRLSMVRPRVRACPTPPRVPEHFAGRDAIAEDLRAKLKAGEATAITAVHGLGGIGKTTLAQKLANDLYADGTFSAVLWSNVTRSADPVALLSSWAYYGDPEFTAANTPTHDLPYRVKALLDDVISENCAGRVLVVLDDVWDASKAAAKLLREACPNRATVLVTTRSENIAVDLCGENKLQLKKMAAEEGVALLRAYLTAVDEPAMTALSEALGGHPLALTLAVRRILKARNPAQALINHTQAYQMGIPAGSTFADLKLEQGETKEDNLTMALAYSYDDLSSSDQRHFRQLGILAHDKPFPLGALATVWEVEPSAAEEICDNLRLLSLIEADDTGDEWYNQHPLLHTYARALLDAAGETDATFAHYTDFVIEEIEQFWDVTDLTLKDWGQIDVLLPHIQALGDTYYGKFFLKDNSLKKIEERMLDFFYLSTPYIVNHRILHRPEWLEVGLLLSEKQNNTDLKSTFLNSLGVYYAQSGDRKKALTYYLQAKTLIKNGNNLSMLLNNIGRIYDDFKQYNKALPYFKEVLKHADASSLSIAHAYNNMGLVYEKTNQPHRALKQYRKALGLLGEDNYIKATVLHNIGCWYLNQKDFDKGQRFLTEALSLRQLVRDDRGTATTLEGLGHIYLQNYPSSPQKALSYYKESLGLKQKSGDKVYMSVAHFNIAQAYRQMGEIDQAIYHMEQCVILDRETENPDLEEDQNFLNSLLALKAPKELDSYQIQSRILAVIGSLSSGDADLCDLTISFLKNDISIAKKHQDINELKFFTALLQIMTGKKPRLSTSNPYHTHLKNLLTDLKRRKI